MDNYKVCLDFSGYPCKMILDFLNLQCVQQNRHFFAHFWGSVYFRLQWKNRLGFVHCETRDPTLEDRLRSLRPSGRFFGDGKSEFYFDNMDDFLDFARHLWELADNISRITVEFGNPFGGMTRGCPVRVNGRKYLHLLDKDWECGTRHSLRGMGGRWHFTVGRDDNRWQRDWSFIDLAYFAAPEISHPESVQ
ncbi:hypothetical protein CEXT_681161 [Caerostris extrusa]|uniref:Uncharacterized protein n=1 Tax=Caerostris extrusa TaxID=172846 RepID=A0AAV4RFH6_CAEEX|nr:hypothetical protein CEXT_681161 [Caerostris extrusa]